MDTSGMFDWNPMSQSQMDQAYLKSIIDANTGENYGARFGAGLGLSLGRMFGGQTAQEAEQNIMKDVFSQAAQEQDPVKRLQTAAALFRQKGMEGRAQQLEAQLLKQQETETDIAYKKAKTIEALRPQAKAEKVDPIIQGISTALGAGKISLANAALAKQAYEKGDYETLKSFGFEVADKKAPSYGPERQAVAKELYGAVFEDLTAEQAKAVNLLVQKREESAKKAGASTLNTVLKPAGQVVGLVRDYEEITKGPRETLRTAQSAMSLINEAASTNNSQTWEAARTQVAKAVGEGKLSNEDIRRTGVDPRLVQGALDWINKKISGVPNQDIMKQLYVVGKVLERNSTEAINKSTERVRRVGKLSGDMSDSDLEVLFPGVPTGKKVNKTKSGTAYEILGE
jgi:hypothetical protein